MLPRKSTRPNCDRLGETARRSLGVGDIGVYDQNPASKSFDCVSGCFRALKIAIDQHNIGAMLGNGNGGRLPHSLSGSGHDRDFAGKIKH